MTYNISDTAKRQFIKDNGLKIPVVEEPHFSYYLDLYEQKFSSRTLYQIYLDSIKNAGGSDQFLKSMRKTREKIIDDVKSNEKYQEFLLCDMSQFDLNNFTTKDSLYNHTNTGKVFVSIDLVEANFQALNAYDKTILNADSYEELVSRYTKNEFFKNSKQIRQVIFGDLNAKRQMKIQKYIMSLVKNVLINNGIKEENIKACSPDEIVFSLQDEYTDETHQYLKSLIKDETISKYKFHLNVFKMEELKKDLSVFVKRYLNKDGYSIKRCSSTNYAEVYKFIEGLPVNELDRSFMYEGRLVYFKDPMF